jgi:hypothetical protein
MAIAGTYPARDEMSEKFVRRFWSKVDKNGPIMPHMETCCWVWTRGTRRGYGVVRVSDKVLMAHRIAYILAHGSIPQKLLALHQCDNPRCCNPSHIQIGTDAQNIAEAIARGRFKGVTLTESQVLDVRRDFASGVSIRQLAKDCGAAWPTVNRAVQGKNTVGSKSKS